MQVVHTCASVSKQYNLVPVGAGQRTVIPATEKVTTGLEKVMAAYRGLYGFGHLPADCNSVDMPTFSSNVQN